MSSIPSQSAPAGLSSLQHALSDAQYSTYARQVSVRAKESLNAGLTIQTREGDLVTLNASSYAEFDSHSYNSQGVVQTENGRAVALQNYREMTLASGERFSFSVEGHLSEEELQDIEAIIGGVDGIIEQMTEGDMEEAVDMALNMGGYSTISSYSADISYERFYSRTTRAVGRAGSVPALNAGDSNHITGLPAPDTPVSQPESPRNSDLFLAASQDLFGNITRLMEEIARNLQDQDDALLAKSREPLDRLFSHHLEKTGQGQDESAPLVTALNETRKQVEQLIDQLTDGIFSRQVSSFQE